MGNVIALSASWRVGFIVLANMAIAYITLGFWKEHWLVTYIGVQLNFYIMFTLLALQYVVLLTYVHRLYPDKVLAYGEHLALSSLIGALLLWPVIFITPPDSWLRTAWLLGVYVFLFFDHLRRDKILKLDITVIGIWMLYRVFLLLCLLGWKFI